MSFANKVAALILCGGKGTRLGPNFKNTNKSLIKINNKTLISTNIDYLLKKKIFNIFVLTGHAHKKVENEVEKKYKKKIHLYFTGLNSSITARIKKTLKILKEFEYVLIINGDSIYKFNLRKILTETIKNNIDCSFVCTSKIIKYGFLQIDHNKKIISFRKNQKFTSFHNSKNYFFYSGMCLIKKELLKKNLKIIKKDFELKLFNKIIKKSKTKVFFDNNKFKDFNNIEDIKNLEKSF